MGCRVAETLQVRHLLALIQSLAFFLHNWEQLTTKGAKHTKNLRIAQSRAAPARFKHRCRLAFGTTFYLNRSVPAEDDGGSLNAIGEKAQNGAVAFATTHWSVVLTAQGESPAAQEALEKLCRTYWRPIYGFVRRQDVEPEEAKDLTQGFFALLLERRDLDAVRKERGRLRSYLLTSLKHFLTNERHRAMAIKRGEGQRLFPLEELSDCER